MVLWPFSTSEWMAEKPNQQTGSHRGLLQRPVAGVVRYGTKRRFRGDPRGDDECVDEDWRYRLRGKYRSRLRNDCHTLQDEQEICRI